MGFSIYGVSRDAVATGDYLEGPKSPESYSFIIQPQVVLAMLIYVLSERSLDRFLMGNDQHSDGGLVARAVMNFCLRSCATPEWKTWRNWYSDDPKERAACVDYLFLNFRSWGYGWYRSPKRSLKLFHAPLLIALHSFVSEQKDWKTTWSIGQTVDLAVLFRTLLDVFEGWDREDAHIMTETLRPYALAFESFSAEGAYSIGFWT